ncbi:hypothetical protein B0F89_105117 [Malaciobacter marinus]|uniref:Uncharacterized protein n=1 Tax=Malaciobacter marinus TaxID=505249 RepID=A0AB36ZXX7_9BACT|nr:colicin Z C-terminal domain-related protein [Malaciobacter marinus]PPK62184.1 hypothetical protein B0F89_105117 [Malaciobacter marinus]
MTMFKAWAPPLGLGWGKWTKIYEHTGMIGFKVSFSSESNAKSTFDIEILEGGKSIPKKIVGPTSTTFMSKDCFCRTKVRFKSHTLGQNILIKVEY